MSDFIIENGILTEYKGDGGDIVIPDGVTKIREYALCTNKPATIIFGEQIPSCKEEDFGYRAKFKISPLAFRTGKRIPGFLAKFVTEYDIEDVAYIFLYQSGQDWQVWLSNANVGPGKLIATSIGVLEKEKKVKPSAVEHLINHMMSNLTRLDKSIVQTTIDFLKDVSPGKAKKLESDGNIKAKLYGLPEHRIEKYVREQKITRDRDVVSIVKHGIAYKDGSGVCSHETIIALLSLYARLYQKNCYTISGSRSSNIELLKHRYLTPSHIADTIADALDKEELCNMLEPSLHGTKYRLLLLTYVRYASEERIVRFINDINTNAKGRVKEKYWAQNAEEALYLNDTLAAAGYFEKNGKLRDYAKMRNYTEADYRDKMMLPDFGMDMNGKRYFDIGNNVIELSVTSDLQLCLLDTGKNKKIRSFPKKGGDDVLIAKAAEEYAKVKKDITEFIKTRTRMLKQMYLSGESVSGSVFDTVYLTHPILKHFTRLLIWKDKRNNSFAVDSEYKTVDINGNAYVPEGSVRLAHVMDMSAEEVSVWQQYLEQHKQKQLFAQMWEPVVIGEEIQPDLYERYIGAVVTSDERNEFKRRMKERGIDVRADTQEGEFDHRMNKYIYNNNNTLNIGSYVRIRYTVNPEKKITTFNAFSMKERCPRRELNIIIFEMDRMCLRHAVKVNDAVNTDLLDSFTAMQISELLQYAIKNNSTNCTALLLEYKNKHFSGFEMDEFTLD